MQIRTAKSNDADAVTKLLERSYPTLMVRSYDAGLLASELPSMTTANPRLLASGSYYLVEEAERVIGCGGWTIEQPGTREVIDGLAHLRHFATDPAHVRQGVGRAIFERCSGAALERGVARFQVFASLNAEVFYRSLGFRRLGIVDLPNGPKLPAVRMELALIQSGRAAMLSSRTN